MNFEFTVPVIESSYDKPKIKDGSYIAVIRHADILIHNSLGLYPLIEYEIQEPLENFGFIVEQPFFINSENQMQKEIAIKNLGMACRQLLNFKEGDTLTKENWKSIISKKAKIDIKCKTSQKGNVYINVNRIQLLPDSAAFQMTAVQPPASVVGGVQVNQILDDDVPF